MDFAHTKENDSDIGHWEILTVHLAHVAELCGKFARDLQVEFLGEYVGAIHDIGKSSENFQRRLKILGGALQGVAPRVNHSGAGAQLLWNENFLMQIESELSCVNIKKEIPNLVFKPLAYLVAGHHAGLPNGGGGEETVEGTLDYLTQYYEPLPWSEKEYTKFLDTYKKELLNWIETDEAINIIKKIYKSRIQSATFFWRLLYSCLVDADFLCTERFMSPDRHGVRESEISMEQLKSAYVKYMDRFCETRSLNNKINQLRLDVSEACSTAAQGEKGVFSLTVPTGGGKTLASLRFAIDHALKHGLKHIVYVIPYTNIIEQTAQRFRDIFHELGENVILEHHSNFVNDISHDSSQIKENEWTWPELCSENWDASIIVTTNVQFFESLFSNKSSKCRKLHRIVSSVIIFDEVQMLPLSVIHPCLTAMNELVQWGASLVLCTATQPAFNYRENFNFGLKNVKEIIPNDWNLFDQLKRVRIQWLGNTPERRFSVEEVYEEIKGLKTFLCIVDTKKWASDLFDFFKNEEDCFHLSAAMCPAHRTQVLNEVRHRLKEKLPCRLIATQLVEAGVDVDFPCVVRSIAGIDSLMQAAGRCNREGKLGEDGDFRIFLTEQESPIEDIRKATKCTLEVLHKKGETLVSDLLNKSTVDQFFKLYLWQRASDLDKGKVMEKWRRNFFTPSAYAYQDIADCFKMIDSPTVPVIIPWDEKSQEFLDKLRKCYDPKKRKSILRKLQPYCVNLYPNILEELTNKLEKIHEHYNCIPNLEDVYDKKKGISVGIFSNYCI